MEHDKKHTFSSLIIALGVFVHLIFLCTLCEIHFSSPIELKTMKSIEPTTDKPDAKRLVLFLADGLRAESIFGTNSHKVPFLNSIMSNIGSWGISHVRPPALPRSGHIAVLSGTYENLLDTIYKSWTSQSINVDSLVNQSSYTWIWSKSKAFNIFNSDHLSHNNSNSTQNGFSSFVEDIQIFLKENKKNIKYSQGVFRKNGLIFLIHLPIVDMYGDEFRSYSNTRKEDIIIKLDKDIELISVAFKNAFKDGYTSYIFTSAYGIANWGSLGGDSKWETETPFIAWGAGIKQNSTKTELKQIDIVPLIASLIGVSLPTNSLGVLPYHFLDLSESFLVTEQATNALQISKIYLEKRKRIKVYSRDFFSYKKLNPLEIEDGFINLSLWKISKQYHQMFKECQHLVNELMGGINYYQTYYKQLLSCCAFIGFLEWIFFLVAYTIGSNDSHKMQSSYSLLSVICIPVYFCYLHKFSVSYYFYVSFPFLMLVILYPHFSDLLHQIVLLFSQWKYYFLFYTGFWVYLFGCFGEYTSEKDRIIWFGLCISLSFLSLAQLNVILNIFLVIYGIFTWIILFYRLNNRILDRSLGYISSKIFTIQKSCLFLCAICRVTLNQGYFSYTSTIEKISWLISIISPISILFTKNLVFLRLTVIVFGVLPFYLMVCSSNELLFLATFISTLLHWMVIETRLFLEYNETDISRDVKFNKYHIKKDHILDIICKVFYQLIFLIAGFYGAGNDTNLYLFYPTSTDFFITTVNPGIKAILHFLKIGVPIFIACSIFQIINLLSKNNPFQIFYCKLIICDIVLLLMAFSFHKAVWFTVSFTQLFVIHNFVVTLLILFWLINILTTFSL